MQAEEAFKKVSRSFGALGNAQKRAEYDRYGSTEEQQGLRQRRPGGGGGFREEDIDPFEVFNMFFGGAGPMGGMGPGVRFHYAVRPYSPGRRVRIVLLVASIPQLSIPCIRVARHTPCISLREVVIEASMDPVACRRGAVARSA
jgi:hypothetical protein